MKTLLVLEDGTAYEGASTGLPGTTWGEVVFNTSMSGYQEMLTDPSYKGQILTFTYPLIGNYGVNEEDFESANVQVEGIIAREICQTPSNWRLTKTLPEFLEENKVVGIEGIDTRALTRHLRRRGVMMGIISTEKTPEELREMLKTLPNYSEIDFVRKVSTTKAYEWSNEQGVKLKKELAPIKLPPSPYNVVVIDYGLKYSILRLLVLFGCKVKVVPCTTSAGEILGMKPDGIVLSPGPGDPERLDYALDTIKELIPKAPLMGICLGHQLLGRAFGGKTYKLKFGHRGANHPVKDLNTNQVQITSQNHGYAVDAGSVEDKGLKISHLNLNDGTVEGMEHKELPIFSIQYHPEVSPGPKDSLHSLERFLNLMKNNSPR